jgi:threonine dehydratase
VIAGAGTIALEILEEQDVDIVVVPVGGGGLLSGIAIATKNVAPAVAVIGVEVEASCPFTRSLAAGRIVEIDVKPTLADGLAGNLDPDTITFEIVRELVDRVVTVGEPQVAGAISDILREERLIAEGAAATGVAAVLAGCVDARDRRVAIVLSGGNIDADKLSALVSGASASTPPRRAE